MRRVTRWLSLVMLAVTAALTVGACAANNDTPPAITGNPLPSNSSSASGSSGASGASGASSTPSSGAPSSGASSTSSSSG